MIINNIKKFFIKNIALPLFLDVKLTMIAAKAYCHPFVVIVAGIVALILFSVLPVSLLLLLLCLFLLPLLPVSRRYFTPLRMAEVINEQLLEDCLVGNLYVRDNAYSIIEIMTRSNAVPTPQQEQIVQGLLKLLLGHTRVVHDVALSFLQKITSSKEIAVTWQEKFIVGFLGSLSLKSNDGTEICNLLLKIIEQSTISHLEWEPLVTELLSSLNVSPEWKAQNGLKIIAALARRKMIPPSLEDKVVIALEPFLHGDQYVSEPASSAIQSIHSLRGQKTLGLPSTSSSSSFNNDGFLISRSFSSDLGDMTSDSPYEKSVPGPSSW